MPVRGGEACVSDAGVASAGLKPHPSEHTRSVSSVGQSNVGWRTRPVSPALRVMRPRMKALFITEHAPASALRPVDIPVPTRGSSDVLIEVEAAGVNPSD